MLNSQDGILVNIGRFDDVEITQTAQLIFPGGEASFDIDGKVTIDFSHFDGFGKVYADFTNASILAMEQIAYFGILPSTFQLEPYFVINAEQNLSTEFL